MFYWKQVHSFPWYQSSWHDIAYSYIIESTLIISHDVVSEEFEDTKGVIRVRISKKNRQHNDQMKRYKRKQGSTKHTYKTKDRVTRTPLQMGGEIMCSARVGSSCSSSDTRCVNLVTNPVISHECGKNREVLTTSGTYPWSFMTQIFHNG